MAWVLPNSLSEEMTLLVGKLLLMASPMLAPDEQ
eukprot:gene23143-17530_t